MTPNLAAVLIAVSIVVGCAVGAVLMWQARPRRPRATTEEAYTDWLEHKAGLRRG